MTNLPPNWVTSQISPFLHYLSIECGLSDNTIKAYRVNLTRFASFCDENGIQSPEHVDPLALQNYARFLSEINLALASIAQNVVTIRMFMRFHVFNGILKKDLCQIMETPRLWQRLPRVLGKEKTIELVTAVDSKSPLFQRDRALLELLYATGMRASEVADMALEDINFQIGYLRCIGKGSKERIIPVHQGALTILDSYIKQLRVKLLGEKICPQIFLSKNGRRLSRIEVWRIVRKAAIHAGLDKHVTPHTLRHCFGTHLLQGGADLRSVQEMLGHASVVTTQIYTHVDQEHLKRIHKKYHPRP